MHYIGEIWGGFFTTRQFSLLSTLMRRIIHQWKALALNFQNLKTIFQSDFWFVNKRKKTVFRAFFKKIDPANSSGMYIHEKTLYIR